LKALYSPFNALLIMQLLSPAVIASWGWINANYHLVLCQLTTVVDANNVDECELLQGVDFLTASSILAVRLL
jgi:hypothetical protein